MNSLNLKWYAVILLLLLILGFLIYLGINSLSFKKNTGSGIPIQSSTPGDFSIFDSVNAAIAGKITKVEGDKIFFENQKGVKGEALIADGVAISDLSKRDMGTPSADLRLIELNKTANIIFSIRDGKYFVISITYPQP